MLKSFSISLAGIKWQERRCKMKLVMERRYLEKSNPPENILVINLGEEPIQESKRETQFHHSAITLQRQSNGQNHCFLFASPGMVIVS